jgi:hypothetical protein
MMHKVIVEASATEEKSLSLSTECFACGVRRYVHFNVNPLVYNLKRALEPSTRVTP